MEDRQNVRAALVSLREGDDAVSASDPAAMDHSTKESSQHIGCPESLFQVLGKAQLQRPNPCASKDQKLKDMKKFVRPMEEFCLLFVPKKKYLSDYVV